MFTGIIETIGAIVERRVSSKDSIVLTIEARDIARQLRIGDSISINGLCQTVISCDETSFKTQAVGPTLDKTTVRGWQVNDRVNLERSMVMGKTARWTYCPRACGRHRNDSPTQAARQGPNRRNRSPRRPYPLYRSRRFMRVRRS